MLASRGKVRQASPKSTPEAVSSPPRCHQAGCQLSLVVCFASGFCSSLLSRKLASAQRGLPCLLFLWSRSVAVAVSAVKEAASTSLVLFLRFFVLRPLLPVFALGPTCKPIATVLYTNTAGGAAASPAALNELLGASKDATDQKNQISRLVAVNYLQLPMSR